MQIDVYTKFVLTLIAAGLFLNAATGLISEVDAYGSGEDVTVTNYETDVRDGETLWVYCTNCE